MITDESIQFIDHTNLTEEYLTQEQDKATLLALAREKQGYESQINVEHAKPEPDQARIAGFTQQIAEINSALGHKAEDREPRSKIHK